ncbi:MAG: hypothetical protein R3E10_00015 [Gemmatimonadota bacterium]
MTSSWAAVAEVPSRLAAALEDAGVGPDAEAARLAAAGVGALRTVESRSDRAAAYVLLAADALLTRACERATVQSDPERALEQVLARLVEGL